jgi:hypothetical protein
LQAFFCIQILIFGAAFVLFFAWRNKFPVSKRTPNVVLLQIFLVGFIGVYFLAFPAFSPTDAQISCFWYNYVFILMFYGVALLIVLRVVVLWNLDFQTRLVAQFHNWSESSLEDFLVNASKLDRFRFWCFRKRNLFFRIPVFCLIAIAIWSEAAIWMFGLFQKLPNPYAIVRGTPECIKVTTPIYTIGAVRLLVLGVLLAFMFHRILRIKENFGLVNEMKSILFVLLGILIYVAICIAVPSVIGTTFHFVVLGCLLEGTWLSTTIVPVLVWTYKFNNSHRGSTFASKPSSEGHSAVSIDKIKHKPSSKSMLRKILESPEGHELFRQYLEREFALENLLFWDAVQDIKKSPDAVKISVYSQLVAKFILADSILCINISSQTRQNIMSALNRSLETSAIDPSLPKHLLEAQEEIIKMLTMDSFLRFKETPGCKSLLVKLMSSIEPDTEEAVAENAFALTSASEL